jgi:hypothetical protein
MAFDEKCGSWSGIGAIIICCSMNGVISVLCIRLRDASTSVVDKLKVLHCHQKAIHSGTDDHCEERSWRISALVTALRGSTSRHLLLVPPKGLLFFVLRLQYVVLRFIQ